MPTELLESLGKMGLPGWVLTIAGILVILHYLGILKATGDFITRERTHDISQEDKESDYRRLRDSWQQEREWDAFEQSEIFVREQVWKKLEAIEAELKKVELVLSQTRDTLGLVYREIFRNSKHDE